MHMVLEEELGGDNGLFYPTDGTGGYLRIEYIGE